MRENAESIKKRFQRDQASLLQSLEQDRSKHKVKVAKSIETDNSLTEDQLEELDRINHSCDKQETLTFSFANENILLALSSTNMDASLLDGNSPGVNVNASEDDQEEDYFDTEDINKSSPTDWLSRVGKVREIYSTAAQNLQREIRKVFSVEWSDSDAIQSLNNERDANMFSVYTGVVTSLMKILIESFDQQISEFSSRKKKQMHESKTMQSESDRFKIKMIVQDQYEKIGYFQSIPAEVLSDEAISFKAKRFLDKVNIMVGQFMRDPVQFKEFKQNIESTKSSSSAISSETKSEEYSSTTGKVLSNPEVKKKDDDDDDEEVHIFRTASESDLGDLSPLKGAQPNASFSISSLSYQQTLAQQSIMQMEVLTSEVSKISSAYNEERQKLELKMKIEQVKITIEQIFISIIGEAKAISAEKTL